MTKLTFIVLLSLVAHCVQGQKFLRLANAGRNGNIDYYEGDKIRFRIKGEKFFREQMILGFTNYAIKFRFFEVPLSEIEAIDIRGRNRWSGGKLLMIAGMGFMGVDAINKTLVRRETYRLEEGIWITAGALVSAGLLLDLARRKKFKISRKRRMYILSV